MQATACFHDGIPHPLLQQADCLLPDPVAFHPTNGLFNTHAGRGNATIGLVLRRGEFPTSWGFLGWEERDGRQANPLKALILLQATAGWQRIAGQFGKSLSSGFPCGGLAQEAHVPGRRDHEAVCERGTRLLATVGVLWRFGIDRAVNRTFGTILPTRGGWSFCPSRTWRPTLRPCGREAVLDGLTHDSTPDAAGASTGSHALGSSRRAALAPLAWDAVSRRSA
jgi:hypothetical protein